MLNIIPVINQINILLAEDTDASVTYAALEARLALEKVCYDRLRQRHDYISHAQLTKWQPGALINTLMQDVDEHITQTVVFSMGQSPTVEGIQPEDDDYIEIGTEVGFNPKLIAKMWNALAKLALHARLPSDTKDRIPEYGDKLKTRSKVEEVVAELERLAKGTMTFSGMGEEVSFVCECGEKNKRRAKLLRNGQHVHCFNSDCKFTWKVIKDGESIEFESVTWTINCEQCDATHEIPRRAFAEMKYDELGSFSCRTCQHKNYVQWWLAKMRVEPAPTDAPEE